MCVVLGIAGFAGDVLGACLQSARRSALVAEDVVGPVENPLGKLLVVTGMTLHSDESASAAGSALW